MGCVLRHRILPLSWRAEDNGAGGWYRASLVSVLGNLRGPLPCNPQQTLRVRNSHPHFGCRKLGLKEAVVPYSNSHN